MSHSELGHATHAVANQVPPLVDFNAFMGDRALREAVRREGADFALAELASLGARAGGRQAIRWGFEANEYPPQLRTHDRYGERIDEVEFHPSWHHLMGVAVSHGLHAAAWRDARVGAHVARAAAFFTWGQVEAGHGCPISMTYAAIPALRMAPHLAAVWEPLFTSRAYDPGLREATQKSGALCGMAMTEKQGGSDVRANTTRALPIEGERALTAYAITGHKWFTSAPMCDAFLVLAQAPGGLSCFLLPRILPDGTRNRFYLQRLKDKLGNRSNASSEVEFDDAIAYLIGEEGRGIPTILEMVNATRLDCINGSASLMRAAVVQAIHHADHRHAFGKRLLEQPLMQNVLADLALESEAATLLLMRLARAADRAHGDPREAAMRRLGTAIGKYYVCKRAAVVAAEALECLGGNGYVEESGMPRLYREAPLNSIWEGSGNVNALDVVRIFGRGTDAIESFTEELRPALCAAPALGAVLADVQRELGEPESAQRNARRIVERLALLLQAALLVEHSPAALADAFLASRLGSDGGRTLGTLAGKADTKAIVDRARIATD